VNQLLAQTPLTVSLDPGVFVIAGIVVLLCGGGCFTFRGRHVASISVGGVSLLLAAYIVLANRYDPEFVMFSVSLLIFCFACFTGLAIWRMWRPERVNA